VASITARTRRPTATASRHCWRISAQPRRDQRRSCPKKNELTKLQELIEQGLERLDTARKGSAEYQMIIRQLVGLRDRVSLLTYEWTDLA